MPLPPTSALDDIATERQRQIAMEGWSHDHDDRHAKGELGKAAAVYAWWGTLSDRTRETVPFYQAVVFRRLWPWDLEWWKPKNRRRDLVRAGALIVAEIERLDRAEQQAK